jgi:hypothetical protein
MENASNVVIIHMEPVHNVLTAQQVQQVALDQLLYLIVPVH